MIESYKEYLRFSRFSGIRCGIIELFGNEFLEILENRRDNKKLWQI